MVIFVSKSPSRYTFISFLPAFLHVHRLGTRFFQTLSFSSYICAGFITNNSYLCNYNRHINTRPTLVTEEKYVNLYIVEIDSSYAHKSRKTPYACYARYTKGLLKFHLEMLLSKYGALHKKTFVSKQRPI